MPDLVPAIEQRAVTELWLARLRTLTDVKVYDGEILNADGSTHPPAIDGDDEGRVGPYVVLYPFGGRRGPEVDVADTSDDLVYGGQLTCAAGYRPDLEYLLDRIRALHRGWVPVLEGVAFGPFKPPTGFVAGSIRRDDTVKPARFWLPLQYVTTATT